MIANTVSRRALTATSTFRRAATAVASSSSQPIQQQRQQQLVCNHSRSIFTSSASLNGPIGDHLGAESAKINHTPKSAQKKGRTAADGGLSDDEHRKKIDDFQSLFVEARNCIEDAQDSADTKYYDEDAEDAKAAVKEAIDSFQELSASLDEERKSSLMAGNGLKVEQLKGEMQLLLDSAH
jgi:hypothetical protein